jgi:hypothetical protein
MYIQYGAFSFLALSCGLSTKNAVRYHASPCDRALLVRGQLGLDVLLASEDGERKRHAIKGGMAPRSSALLMNIMYINPDSPCLIETKIVEMKYISFKS